MLDENMNGGNLREFCEAFRKQHDKLDVLIHNAAYFNHGAKFLLSEDQLELTFATNVFCPFLMSSLLRDLLKRSEDPRIFHAGSNIIKHFFDMKTNVELDTAVCNVKEGHKHSVYKMYCQSKMALLMLTFKMAEEYKEDGIKVNYLLINGAKMSKRTMKKFKLRWKMVAWMQNLFLRDPQYMADKYYKICSLDSFRSHTGKLFNDKLEVMKAAPKQFPGFAKQLKQILGNDVYPSYAEDREVWEKLWNLCNELLQQELDFNAGNTNHGFQREIS